MAEREAILSSEGDMTSFSYGGINVRFKTSPSLVRWLEVREWDRGYIVCDALYRHSEEPIEEYIDLVPILKKLYIDPTVFLKDIETVRVCYDRPVVRP